MPGAMPVTTPVGLTVATVVGAMVHTPPVGNADNDLVPPAQRGLLPVIGPGIPFTVTIEVVFPQEVWYVTVAVPADMPSTTPVGLTVATVTGVMLHVPPAGDALNGIVVPAQNGILPVTAPGPGLMPILAVSVSKTNGAKQLVAI